MKESLFNKIRKKVIPLFVAGSALGVTIMCTSCQANDEPQEEDLPVIAENSQEAETSTTEETQSVTTASTVTTTETQARSIILQTTTTITTLSTEARSVPMGTQAEVTKPPTTHYDEWPAQYATTTANGTAVTGGTEDTTISSSVGTAYSESPNSTFYQERLYIAGDSIAYGFNAYGLIPSEHNIAKESVSMWNLDYFTFNTGLGLVDTIGYTQPSLLYMSMGMNDVNTSTAEEFAERYKTAINQIRDQVPDINIIVAGITPVTNESEFANNDVICSFNTALKNMVTELNSNHVYYFDAYSVVADPATNSLRPENTGGDGIHLTTQCYYDTLNSLFTYLDTTPVKSNIEKSESAGE
ncbi:MAG: hypothetical protein K2I80_05680 [Ruminococcus sp.]|nr:hypothetical protein [Ruminococcus sp.]